jgi:hypothetical protein
VKSAGHPRSDSDGRPSNPKSPLSGHFTKLAAASNRPFGKIPERHGADDGGCVLGCWPRSLMERKQPPSRFGIRKQRDVGHRTGPWAGHVLKPRPGKRHVFQQYAVMPQVRMMSFSHEPLRTFSMIRSADRGVTGCSTHRNPAFLTNYPTTTKLLPISEPYRKSTIIMLKSEVYQYKCNLS